MVALVRPGVRLADILDTDLLRRDVDEGLIARQFHPELPLTIYNYTPAAVWQRAWDPATIMCRGLIVDADGFVIGRPFAKFFNLGEPSAPPVPDGLPEVYDKADGSLAVLCSFNDELVVATRGSFGSTQARWASRWCDQHLDGWVPPAGVTVCGEIIFPTNRIVVDYADREEILGLGAIDNATGEDINLVGAGWPGAIVERFHGFVDVDHIRHHIDTEDWNNSEGFVLCWPQPAGPAIRLKVKFAEYVRLHKVLTGLTNVDVLTAWIADLLPDADHKRVAWALHAPPEELATMMSNGGNVDQIIAAVPDEFYSWVEGLIVGFEAQMAEMVTQVQDLVATLPSDRKAAAAIVLTQELPGKAYFTALDGHDPRIELIRPLIPTRAESFASGTS